MFFLTFRHSFYSDGRCLMCFFFGFFFFFFRGWMPLRPLQRRKTPSVTSLHLLHTLMLTLWMSLWRKRSSVLILHLFAIASFIFVFFSSNKEKKKKVLHPASSSHPSILCGAPASRRHRPPPRPSGGGIPVSECAPQPNDFLLEPAPVNSAPFDHANQIENLHLAGQTPRNHASASLLFFLRAHVCSKKINK